MAKKYCNDCLRFERPKREGEMGYCTQCGEDTSAYGPECHWFTPRRASHEEKED